MELINLYVACTVIIPADLYDTIPLRFLFMLHPQCCWRTHHTNKASAAATQLDFLLCQNPKDFVFHIYLHPCCCVVSLLDGYVQFTTLKFFLSLPVFGCKIITIAKFEPFLPYNTEPLLWSHGRTCSHSSFHTGHCSTWTVQKLQFVPGMVQVMFVYFTCSRGVPKCWKGFLKYKLSYQAAQRNRSKERVHIKLNSKWQFSSITTHSTYLSELIIK